VRSIPLYRYFLLTNERFESGKRFGYPIFCAISERLCGKLGDAIVKPYSYKVHGYRFTYRFSEVDVWRAYHRFARFKQVGRVVSHAVFKASLFKKIDCVAIVEIVSLSEKRKVLEISVMHRVKLDRP
jgi:hypothetical protein